MNIKIESSALKYALSKSMGDFARLQKILWFIYSKSEDTSAWKFVDVDQLKLACMKGSWTHARVMKIIKSQEVHYGEV